VASHVGDRAYSFAAVAVAAPSWFYVTRHRIRREYLRVTRTAPPLA
jgi:hypothetical protein